LFGQTAERIAPWVDRRNSRSQCVHRKRKKKNDKKATCRIYLVLDIIGAFMLMVIALIGMYSLREGTIDMSCITTWGMISFINGILDLVVIIDRAVKAKAAGQPAFYNDGFPFWLNVIITFYLIGPVCEV